MVRDHGRKKRGMIGFYKRKFVFFLLIFIVVFLGIKVIRENTFSADESFGDEIQDSFSKNIDITVLANGDINVNGQKINQKVDLLNEFDEVRLVLLDNPGEYYDHVTAKLNLPGDATKDVQHEFLGIHGVGYSASFISSNNQITYTATSVSSQATLTVVAKLPKGVISPPISRQLFQSLKNLKGSSWLIIAIFPPVLTFILLLFLISNQFKNQKIDVPDKEISSPPMAIPPAIVGALYSQKVGSREIAATLIDLAMRGDIIIVDRERGFEFGKNRFDKRLLGFEKVLLSKIFQKNIFSNREDIEQRINNHFYSKKISIVSSGVYTLATRLGYFKVNPQYLHAKYRFIGIGAFFLALGGFVASLTWFTDPPYAIFFWVGMMISALLISIIASKMPVRTVIGQDVLSNWLAFKRFLSNPELYPFAENNQEIFQKYLPYALVLECEAAWARRFQKHNFVAPDWFVTEKLGLGLEDFCLLLFPIISYVGRSLSALKEPGFE